VFYQFLGFNDPSTIFRWNVVTGQTALFQRAALNFDRSRYVVKQVFYTSKDGTRIPMFLLHRRDLKLDGNAPAFLYGYGGMGWISFTWFRPDRLVWLEMGGVYAQPSLRGGGEYGADWHRAGLKQHKQTVIDDYLAAAEWLVKNKYTSASKLVANGGSLSGPLAGAAIQQRPDLFGAAVIDIPVLDLLRFDQFTGGAYWQPELGSPADPQEFQALRAYSPVHNAKPGQCYPPALVMAGELDQTAPPLHAHKFVAAMQAAQGCAQPILLKTMRGTGHSQGSTPAQIADSFTDELSFLTRALKLRAPAPRDEEANFSRFKKRRAGL
jgi:prolyl oligopeptidase